MSLAILAARNDLPIPPIPSMQIIFFPLFDIHTSYFNMFVIGGIFMSVSMRETGLKLPEFEALPTIALAALHTTHPT